jgi:hypothetical protein
MKNLDAAKETKIKMVTAFMKEVAEP